MAISEAKKRADAKWSKANRKTISCTLPNAEHAAFKAYAEQHGKTVSGMLLAYIRSCIAEGTKNMEQPTATEQTGK